MQKGTEKKGLFRHRRLNVPWRQKEQATDREPGPRAGELEIDPAGGTRGKGTRDENKERDGRSGGGRKNRGILAGIVTCFTGNAHRSWPGRKNAQNAS